ncbi:nucleotidyltransferase family protein [Aquifex sp.]
MRQLKSSGSVKAVYLERDKLISKLKELSQRLREKYDWIKEVRVFGSLARGEERGLSDVDLLVVTKVKVSKENFWDLYGKVFDEAVDILPISFDLLLISEEDFKGNEGKFGKNVKIEELS